MAAAPSHVDASVEVVENTPLLVNLLRLIRDSRSPFYDDHEHGDTPFHFGGLRMSDSGPFKDAEDVWASFAAKAQVPGKDVRTGLPPRGSSFAGPLTLVVSVEGVVVEHWIVEDYREDHTEHSIPRDYEQLEEINALVRLLYAYLRIQDVYALVLQKCTQRGTLVVPPSSTTTRTYCDDSDSNAASVTGYTSGGSVCLRVYGTEEDCPAITDTFPRMQRWTTGDLVSVTVHTNVLWRSQLMHTIVPTHTPSTTTAAALNSPTAADAASLHTAPVPVPGSAALSSPNSVVRSPTNAASGESGGALRGKSLPTPHLAPSTSLPTSTGLGRIVSPNALLGSPTSMAPDFALPPSEVQVMGGGGGGGVLGSPTALPRYSPPTTTTRSLSITAHSQPEATAVEWAPSLHPESVAHVQRMGYLFPHEADPADAEHEVPWYASVMNPFEDLPLSTMAAASMEDIDAGVGFHDSHATSSPGAAAAPDAMSLLLFCSTAKLRQARPAEFGELVLALHLEGRTE